MIGDGRADFDAARALNLDFVFLAQYSDWVTAELDLKDAPRTRIVHTWQELLAEDGPRQASVSTYRGKGQDQPCRKRRHLLLCEARPVLPNTGKIS